MTSNERNVNASIALHMVFISKVFGNLLSYLQSSHSIINNIVR